MAVRYRRSSSLEGHAQVIGRFVLPRVAGCVKGGASRARERDDANVDIPCRPDIALSRKHLGRSTDVISLHQRGVLVTRIRRKTRCREKNVVKRIQSKKKAKQSVWAIPVNRVLTLFRHLLKVISKLSRSGKAFSLCPVLIHPSRNDLPSEPRS